MVGDRGKVLGDEATRAEFATTNFQKLRKETGDEIETLRKEKAELERLVEQWQTLAHKVLAQQARRSSAARQ